MPTAIADDATVAERRRILDALAAPPCPPWKDLVRMEPRLATVDRLARGFKPDRWCARCVRRGQRCTLQCVWNEFRVLLPRIVGPRRDPADGHPILSSEAALVEAQAHIHTALYLNGWRKDGTQ